MRGREARVCFARSLSKKTQRAPCVKALLRRSERARVFASGACPRSSSNTTEHTRKKQAAMLASVQQLAARPVAATRGVVVRKQVVSVVASGPRWKATMKHRRTRPIKVRGGQSNCGPRGSGARATMRGARASGTRASALSLVGARWACRRRACGLAACSRARVCAALAAPSARSLRPLRRRPKARHAGESRP